MKHKILSLLALLLTAATGAWATTDPNSVYWDKQTWSGWADSETTHTVGDITITATGSGKVYQSTSSGEPLGMDAGNNDAITFTSNGAPFKSIKIKMDGGTDPGIAGWTYDSSKGTLEWSGTPSTSVTLSGCNFKADKITFTFGSAEPDIEVKWDAATKTGTFVMPAFDVEIDPIYAPVAEFATDGKPTPIEGIIAGEAKDIVKAGTVATTKIGEADHIAQGTVMYAVTTENKKPTSTTGFSATVPTGAVLTGSYAEDQTVYVWYYIKGIDAAEGVAPKAENTFNDSEICTTPLTVKLKANQFTLTLNPAPVKNMTVTAGTETKTPTTEGKTDIKINSEVKLKANEGYKIKKVEVKKTPKE